MKKLVNTSIDIVKNLLYGNSKERKLVDSFIKNIYELRSELSLKPVPIDPTIESIDLSVRDMIAQLKAVPYVPFPISFSTVDIIATDLPLHDPDCQVLLGRKPGQLLYQFPGGFRDPGETNKTAAAREFDEECKIKFDSDRLNFLSERFIDDNRYKESPHKITTHIYHIVLNDAEVSYVTAGDDLEEVQWFKISDLMDNSSSVIRTVHGKILNLLLTRVAYERAVHDI